MREAVKLGISSCLLGEEVRYDGGHKLDRYLRDVIGKHVEYIPVCPEMECGLGTPREAMQLVGNPESPRVITIQGKVDHTELLVRWSRRRVAQLAKENLRGFIFKSKSPSCGMERVEVFDETGMPQRKGIGIFARIFRECFPQIPVEDDERLQNPGFREKFLGLAMGSERWQSILTSGQICNSTEGREMAPFPDDSPEEESE